MAFADEVSDFVGRIYGAAGGEEDWGELSKEALALTGGQWMCATVIDHRDEQVGGLRFFGLDPAAADRAMSEYREGLHKSDRTLQAVLAQPRRRWIDSQTEFGAENYLQNDFVRWSLSRFGSTHWVVGATPPKDDLSLALALHAPPEQGPLKRRQHRLFRVIFDHFERAIRLRARQPNLEGSNEAMMLLNHLGEVVQMNDRARAVLEAGDGIRLVGRHLCGTDDRSAARLKSLIDAALPSRRSLATGGAVPMRRHAERGWILKVEPLPRGAFPLGLQLPGALVTITDPDSIRLTLQQRQIFKLTAREAELAEQLVNGATLDEAAAVLSISPNTARVHLRSLFQKTGSNRQVDLVRILLVTV